MIRIALCLAAWASALCVSHAVAAQDVDTTPILPGVALNEQRLRIPGDPGRPTTLAATLLSPPGAGPFPLAVVNHGADDDTRAHIYRRTFFAYYFLSRGYAVLLPMMRGFAGTGGVQQAQRCDVTDVALANAADIRAAINDVAGRPELDASHVVVVGQSFGGWNTLALGASSDPRVVGLINASGGIRSSNCDDDDRELTDASATFGRRTKIPSLWFYTDNDALFPPRLWRAMYAAYTRAGGHAELDPLGQVAGEAHAFSKYPENLSLWAPKVDAFLAGLNLPNRVTHLEYQPKPWPKPTGFAALADIAAVPYLNDQARELYSQYLQKPIPKAFVLSPAGFASAQYGGLDPVQTGMDACRAAGKICRPYAVDDQVVWSALPARPPASGYAAIGDAKALPYPTEVGQALYQRFLAHAGPRALVISPDGSAFAQYGGPDAFAAAWLKCADAKLICEPYAVDDQVVWVKPAPLPAASHFARLEDVDAVPYLTGEGRQGYKAYLAKPKPRAFAIAPGGVWKAGSGGKATARHVLAACRKAHPDCNLYAIDDAVVWR